MDKSIILEDWNEQFSIVEKLRISEVKELYKKINETDNKELRKNYYNKIILGTEHVVYNYLKSTNIYLLSSMNADTEDIIATTYETWIENIKNGKLNEANSFSQITQANTFSYSIEEKMGLNSQFDISSSSEFASSQFYKNGKKHSDNALGVLTDLELRKSFVKYYRLRQLGDEKIDLTEQVFEDSKISNDQKVRVASFFDKTCDYLDSTIGDTKISDTNLAKYIKLVISNTITSDSTDNSMLIDNNDVDSEVIENNMREKLIESFETAQLTDTEKFIIRKRFGIDGGGCKTLEETGESLGASKIGILLTEAKALHKLRTPKSARGLQSFL